MNRRRFQFSLADLLWLVVFAACNFWMFRFGPIGVIIAIVIDKHILVAYLCCSARVDRRDADARCETPARADVKQAA